MGTVFITFYSTLTGNKYIHDALFSLLFLVVLKKNSLCIFRRGAYIDVKPHMGMGELNLLPKVHLKINPARGTGWRGTSKNFVAIDISDNLFTKYIVLVVLVMEGEGLV